MNFEEVINELKQHSDTKSIEGMRRFGISPDKIYAVKIPILRSIAKQTGKDHELALELWKHGYREAQIIASMIADPKIITDQLMDEFIKEFNYWEICDQFCMNLFEKMDNAYEKALEYSYREPMFEKRTGFVLMARLAVSDKKAPDKKFEPFFQRIIDESSDSRNDVRKSVNWALRQIGKRNIALRDQAMKIITAILDKEDSVKWIAKDARRELEDVRILERLKERARK